MRKHFCYDCIYFEAGDGGYYWLKDPNAGDAPEGFCKLHCDVAYSMDEACEDFKSWEDLNNDCSWNY